MSWKDVGSASRILLGMLSGSGALPFASFFKIVVKKNSCEVV